MNFLSNKQKIFIKLFINLIVYKGRKPQMDSISEKMYYFFFIFKLNKLKTLDTCFLTRKKTLN